MKRVPIIVIALAAAAAIAYLVWPKPAATPDKPLICYVGGTMRPVFEALTDAYKAKTGRSIEITSADSGELLATIEMQKAGDMYVAHDPFMDVAMQRGLGVNAWCLGEIYPVIIVAKGNPKNITSLKDFFRPDVKVYLTDYKNSTLGYLLPIMFKRAGLDFDELNRTKEIPTLRGGSGVANQVKMKSADTGLVWQAVAYLRSNDLDMVPITDALPQPGVDTVTSATGKVYPAAPVKVTLVSLKYSNRQDDIEQFVKFLASDEARKIFESNSYKTSAIYGARAYANGVSQPLPGQ